MEPETKIEIVPQSKWLASVGDWQNVTVSTLYQTRQILSFQVQKSCTGILNTLWPIINVSLLPDNSSIGIETCPYVVDVEIQT